MGCAQCGTRNLGQRKITQDLDLKGREITQTCIWLVQLSGFSVSLWTKGSPVWFLVRAQAWVVGWVPSRGHVRGNHTLMFLFLSFSKNKSITSLKKKRKNSEPSHSFGKWSCVCVCVCVQQRLVLTTQKEPGRRGLRSGCLTLYKTDYYWIIYCIALWRK